MAKEKRPLTQQDAFDLSPAVREAAWGLKGHLLRNGHADESGRPMTAPDDVRARFEWFVRRELAGELPLDRDSSGEYLVEKTRNALRSWQAAHADLAGDVRELVEAATEMRSNFRCVLDVNCKCDQQFIDRQTERLDAALAKFTHQEKPDG